MNVKEKAETYETAMEMYDRQIAQAQLEAESAYDVVARAQAYDKAANLRVAKREFQQMSHEDASRYYQAQAQAQRNPLLDDPRMRSVVAAMPYRYDDGTDMSLEDKAKTYAWSAQEQAKKIAREADEAVRGFNNT